MGASHRPIETAEYRRGYKAGYLRALQEVERLQASDPTFSGPTQIAQHLRDRVKKDADGPTET